MIPTTMRAAAIDRFGGPEVLSIHTLPVPQPNANEVLIALEAAGVGTWDVGFVDGSYVYHSVDLRRELFHFSAPPGSNVRGPQLSLSQRQYTVHE